MAKDVSEQKTGLGRMYNKPSNRQSEEPEEVERQEESEGEKIAKVLTYQIRREVIKLYKSNLKLFETLVDEGIISHDEFAYFRKEILDRGNDCVREIEDDLKVYGEVFGVK